MADGPADACVWLDASDGVRLRAARWDAPAQVGTLLLFPGRTEFVEKYARVARRFNAQGWTVAAVDWRGQGLSDRLAADRALGHVERFADYQRDVAAFADWAHPGAGRVALLAHSMGGAIGLRALHEGLAVERAVFSGPMWGIEIRPHMRPVAWMVSWAAKKAGRALRYTPGMSSENLLADGTFELNPLTTDPDIYAWMANQIAAHPELGIGGASLGWLREALTETRALRALEPPAMPMLVGVGSDEAVVDVRAIESIAERWEGGRMVVYPKGRHELLMEAEAMREGFLGDIAAFLAAA